MDALRAVVQPVTHNLPGPVRDLGVSLLGDACYRTLVLDVDPTDTPCLRLAVSKALGVGIVAASAVVKVPQIVKLVRARSAAGVSFLSYLLETTSYLVSLAYNVRRGFPFSTYGETAFILAQNVVITLLVLHYSGRRGWAATLAAGIWLEGGTGQLSAFTVFNYLLGSLSRIFTTLQEVDDPLILYAFVAGFALNAVLAAQVVYYWNTPTAKATAQKRTNKKSGAKKATKKQ
ncbi:polyketide synthase [Niveomyces insectorum RCEF 264]|uniref:Solute carrier family 66 member 3 n=1 Tax=Niveomyces insectorum RCEF 264 TaxID=1081102 RepID=A0A162JCT0_9HYPO|nr:polyketide synthase [Niveomyces insectorum RCEF 264]